MLGAFLNSTDILRLVRKLRYLSGQINIGDCTISHNYLQPSLMHSRVLEHVVKAGETLLSHATYNEAYTMPYRVLPPTLQSGNYLNDTF